MTNMFMKIIEPLLVREATSAPMTTVAPQESKRPLTWDSICGQNQVKEKLQIRVASAKRSNSTINHLLFTGPSGVGKTTMVGVLANTLGVKVVNLFAPRISKTKEIIEAIKTAKDGDIIFIDEAQKLSSNMQQSLLDILEDFIIHEPEGDVHVAKFALMMATTHEGQLQEALRRRFTTIEMSLYTLEELTQIISNAAIGIYSTPLSVQICRSLANLSWGVPYKALWLLETLMVTVKGENVTMQNVEEMLRLEGIDPLIGLNPIARRYLLMLTRQQDVARGLESLATILHTPIDTLKNVIEPFLMSDITLSTVHGTYIGPLVEPSARGRIATKMAYLYLDECRRAQKETGWFASENLCATTHPPTEEPQSEFAGSGIAF